MALTFKAQKFSFDPNTQQLQVFKSDDLVATVSRKGNLLDCSETVYNILAEQGIRIPANQQSLYGNKDRIVLPDPSAKDLDALFEEFLRAYLDIYLSKFNNITVKVIDASKA